VIVSRRRSTGAATESPQPAKERPAIASGGGSLLALLFATGLTSMGMEVVWIRQFTPYLGTMVYAFAAILGTYLAATFLGSRLYRRWSRREAQAAPALWSALALT